MNTTFNQGFTAGIVATIAMTLFMMLTTALGMPRMNPPQMLADTMGVGVFLGWITHFMIGIVFGFLYTFIFLSILSKIKNTLIRGLLFGMIAFAIAQLGMKIMSSMMPQMSMPTGNLMIMTIGSLVGHMVFGIVVVYFVKFASAK